MDSIGNLISASGAATPTTFHRTDGDWLPSATAKLAFSDDIIVRLGAAKVVAFPNTADLNNGLTLFNNAVFVNGVQTTLGTGNGGAPNLNPFKANQLDASFEYYFGHQALFSLGLFYKDVSTFIVQRQSAESYAGVNYLINRKINGDSATVKGVEALLQLPFDFLPEPFDGFGVFGTYSYIDSSTPIKDVAGRTLPFPGLSKNNVNLVGYYEKGPVSFRLAYNWRDDYLIGLSAAATGIYNDAYTDLSATFRYDLTQDISLNLEANNLLDAEQRTYDGSAEALRTNVFFGRIYKASVSVKF
jgi:iron complex outermembrane receptor protein